VFAYTRPAVPDQGHLERAQATMDEQPSAMLQWLLNVVTATTLSGEYSPSLTRSPYLFRHGGDMWRWSNRPREDWGEATSTPVASRHDFKHRRSRADVLRRATTRSRASRTPAT